MRPVAGDSMSLAALAVAVSIEFAAASTDIPFFATVAPDRISTL